MREGYHVILGQYRPQAVWFGHNAYGIHGIEHVTRVLIWADHLVQSAVATGQPVDGEVVRWAAVLHDVGRKNDDRDPEHGLRSARWIDGHRELLPPALTQSQLDAIQYCCIWHVPADRLTPMMTPELLCLKDADAVDRVRIGDLNPAMLRTSYSRKLIDPAARLCQLGAIDAEPDPWQRIRKAALTLGLWR